MSWPVTDAFKTAVRSSHVVAQQVDVLDSGAVAATLQVTVDGTVTEERADVRRRGDFEVVDDDGTLTPAVATDLLAPFGNEVRPWRGVRFPDGTVELVPLATLVITSVEVEWPRIRLSGFDRAWLVQQARFTSPYQIPQGTNVATAIQTLLENRLPGYVEFNLPSTAETTPRLVYEQESDPWQAATELANTIGMQLFCDRLGVVSMVSEPDLTEDQPIATFDEGDQGVLLGLTRGLDAQAAFNGVIAFGETTGSTPVRAEVWDDNPSSPTYRAGKFGERPHFYSSPTVDTAAKAELAAKTLLKRELGVADQIRFPIVVDPSLDVGDIVYINRMASHVDALHVLDSLTIPLRANQPMDAASRSRQVLL